MKFSDIKPAPIQRLDVEVDLISGMEPFKVSVRQLLADQDAAVLAKARAFAKEHGVESPSDDHPLYLLGLFAATLEAGVLCADEAEPVPFFDLGMKQILERLDRDRIAHLWALQGAWQDKCSGLEAPLTQHDVIVHAQLIAAAAPGDERVFAALRPGFQRRLLRGFAVLLVACGEIMEAQQKSAALPPGGA